jgi:methylglutaconyl-CoA hydratase
MSEDRIMIEQSMVLRESVGPIAVVTLNRPDRRNALSRRLMDELGDTISHIALDPKVRVMVIAGAGPSFCAGMDLHEAIEAMSSEMAEETAIADTKEIAHLINQIHLFPKPTIAELDGPALGGGAGLAMACDFIVMSSRARIGFPEVLRGLVPSIVMHDVVRQVGDKRARQLLLTGQILDAEEAGRWGLTNAVVEPGRCREETLSLGRRLLATAPRAYESTKRLIDEATRRPGSLSGAAAISAAARVGGEAVEGMRAFAEKRPPKWDLSTEEKDHRS